MGRADTSAIAGSSAGKAAWLHVLNVPAVCTVVPLLEIYP